MTQRQVQGIQKMQKDTQKLMASVQSRQSTDNDELTGHSSDIIDELTDLIKKAQAEIGGNGHFKSNAAHDFAKLKQSLENQNNKAKSESTAQTAKSDDLTEVEKRLTSLKTYRSASKSTCSQLETDHETSA